MENKKQKSASPEGGRFYRQLEINNQHMLSFSGCGWGTPIVDYV